MAEIEYRGRVQSMAEPYAGLLVKIGKAKYATREVKAEEPVEDKPKRKYKRRDMRADAE